MAARDAVAGGTSAQENKENAQSVSLLSVGSGDGARKS